MAANDSGVDTSNDSNDNSTAFPTYPIIAFSHPLVVTYTTKNELLFGTAGSSSSSNTGNGNNNAGAATAADDTEMSTDASAATAIDVAGPSSGHITGVAQIPMLHTIATSFSTPLVPPGPGPSSSSLSPPSLNSPPRSQQNRTSHYRQQLSLSAGSSNISTYLSSSHPNGSSSSSCSGGGSSSSGGGGPLAHHHSYKMKTKINTHQRNTLPYIRSQSNERKLRLAASLSNVEVLIRLLESGVDPNSSDDYQRSALHLAASRGYTDVVTQLLKHGANPNLKDSLGNTPLHLAVCSASSFNFNMVVRILLKHGASVHALDQMGKNPLDLAKSKLSLMRSRREQEVAPESRRMMLDMSLLTSFLLWTYMKEEQSQEDINSLEMRLSSLSTKEVEDEADMLLAKVEQLTLKN